MWATGWCSLTSAACRAPVGSSRCGQRSWICSRYLAARPGEVVSKEQLLDDVWGSRVVSESALTRTVTELRQALGDNAEAPHLLETIPKRGYRLIGSVVPVDPTARAGSLSTERTTDNAGSARSWRAASCSPS